jgi:lysozyme
MNRFSILLYTLTVAPLSCFSPGNCYAYNSLNELLEEEQFIESKEGFSSTPYQCSRGKNTIGYGHELKQSEHYKKVDKDFSEKLLVRDIKEVEAFIKKVVKVKLSNGQFKALVSLVYNWGEGNFLKSQGLLVLNQGNYTDAAQEFFSKDKGVVKVNGKFSHGLYVRRQAELELWNDKT